MVSGPQRNAAWRVLDAQYFGLAQRRKRVFVVACPRDGADPRKILFECEGVPRHSPPRREAWEGTAGTLAARTGAGGGLGTDFDLGGGLTVSTQPIGIDKEQNATVDFFGTLKARQEGGGFEGSVFVPGSSHCLNAGGMGRIDYETETLVAHTLTKRYDSSEDGCGQAENYHAMAGSFGVRRLTPREAERLQGFPDDYTALDKAADGPRYKALGNSMAVPVIRWIIERIAKELDA